MNMEDRLLQMMRDIDKCDDTLWLTEMETVFERCWHILAQGSGWDDRLRLEFPHYA